LRFHYVATGPGAAIGPALWGVSLDLKVEDLLSNIRKSVDDDIDSLLHGTTSQSRGTLMRGALREMRVTMTDDVTPASTVNDEISDLRARIKKKVEQAGKDPFAAAAATATPLKPAPRPAATGRQDFTGIMAGPITREPTRAPAREPIREALRERERERSLPLRPSLANRDDDHDLRYVSRQPAQRWQEPPPPAHDHYTHDAFGQPLDAYQEDPYAQDYGAPEHDYAPAYQTALPGPLLSPQSEAMTESAFQHLSESILARATGDRGLEEMTRDMVRGIVKQWLDANLPTIVEDMVREEINRVARRTR
jgi:cell pole-organizing protein PopZ